MGFPRVIKCYEKVRFDSYVKTLVKVRQSYNLAFPSAMSYSML